MTLGALSAVVLASIAAGAIGLAIARWLRRYTTLSIRNLYPAATVLSALMVATTAAAVWVVAAVQGVAGRTGVHGAPSSDQN